jgi:hypothetical protein
LTEVAADDQQSVTVPKQAQRGAAMLTGLPAGRRQQHLGHRGGPELRVLAVGRLQVTLIPGTSTLMSREPSDVDATLNTGDGWSRPQWVSGKSPGTATMVRRRAHPGC